MKRIFLALAAFSFLAISCDLLNPEPYLSTDVESIDVDAEGGLFTINVKSNCKWKATAVPSTGVEFFSLLSAGGEAGTGTIRMSVEQNKMYGKRSGNVELEYWNDSGSGTCSVTVVQEASDLDIHFLDKKETVLPAEGGSFKIMFTTNTYAYFVVVPEDERGETVKIDLDLVESYGKPGTGTLTVTVAANTTPVPRTFTLQIGSRHDLAVSDSFSFSQAGK